MSDNNQYTMPGEAMEKLQELNTLVSMLYTMDADADREVLDRQLKSARGTAVECVWVVNNSHPKVDAIKPHHLTGDEPRTQPSAENESIPWSVKDNESNR